MPQYVTRMTPAQMAAESKKATEEGMRQIAAGLASRGRRQAISLEDESDSDTEPTSSQLETRIHYMKLDMANKNVDLQDAKDLIQTYRDKEEILKKVEDNILLLTNLSFYLNNIETLTVEQLKNKLALFKEECAEHSANCLFYIKKIEYQLIKNYMILALDEMNLKNTIIEKKIVQNIRYKNFINYLLLWLIIWCVITLIGIPFLYTV